MSSMRIGHGYDAHTFCADRALILAGVTIPHTHGLKGHSDADVIIHALCDAMLGAMALGDIGQHFPDTNADYKGYNSRLFLLEVKQLLLNHNYEIGNVDITVLAQAPKLATYIKPMRANIANDLLCELDQVNIKATTTEKMGFIGREEGIAAHAVILLETTA